MSTKSLLCSGAAAGAILALSLGGAAQAAPKHTAAVASQADLDALRAEVEALKSQLDQQTAANADKTAQLQQAQAQIAAAQATATQAAQTSQAAERQIETIPTVVQTAVNAAKPKTDKLYYKGVAITLGGFAAAEGAYRSHDQTADIGSSYAKIPFGNDRAGRTSETTATARQSRYSLLAQGSPNDGTVVGFYGEFDFLGAAQTANSNESNSYQLRVRNLYGQVDWKSGWHLMAGQSWSLATLNAAGITPRSEVIPASIDAQYVPGFVWSRQPGVRVTYDFNKEFWIAVAAENAQTTFGNVSTASGVTLTNTQAPTSQFFSGTNYSLNNVPDLIAKVAVEENWAGHAFHGEVFGIYRSYLDRVNVAPAAGTQAATLGYVAGNYSRTSSGGGVGAGVTFTVVPKFLDVQLSGLTGTGIGRYGSGQLSDVTAAPDGTLKGIQETMFLAGGTLHATPMLDVYLYGGQERESGKIFRPAGLPVTTAFGFGTLPGSSNAGCIVEGGTCSAVTKSIGQITGGFWDKIYNGPFGQLRFGLQYSYTTRDAFADASGLAPKANESMIFTSLRYYPF